MTRRTLRYLPSYDAGCSRLNLVSSHPLQAVGAEAFGMKVEFAKLGFRASGFSGTAEVGPQF